MIVTAGGRWGGYGLYLLKGVPVFNYNMLMLLQARWAGDQPLSPGKHTIRIAYALNVEKTPLRPVSQPVEIEVGKQSDWGKDDGGIQALADVPQRRAHPGLFGELLREGSAAAR